jgi:mycofactocin radical SAM maturase
MNSVVTTAVRSSMASTAVSQSRRAHQVGVKFSTNGVKLTPERARWLADSDYVDVQISLDGATAEVNDAVRGPGSYDTAIRAMRNLADAGFRGFKLSVVMTRGNVGQLDQFAEIADTYGAQLRITRLRPSGRGADVWDELHPTAEQQLELYRWLLARGEKVLTGDSFFHLNALGSDPLPGLNLCGAGRVVCLIDPVGDVYACPFAIHQEFLAGNVRDEGGFARVWTDSELFTRLRGPQTGGACTSCSAVLFFQAIVDEVPEHCWTPAIETGGPIRDGAWVAEVTGMLNLTTWPETLRSSCVPNVPTPAPS